MEFEVPYCNSKREQLQEEKSDGSAEKHDSSVGMKEEKENACVHGRRGQEEG